MATTGPNTTNPAGSPKVRDLSRPRPVAQGVRELQDPAHTEADFLRDLEKATTNRASERLEEGDPSRPDRGSSGT